MANLAITSPHFFALRACLATPFSLQFLNCWCNFRIPTAKLASGFPLSGKTLKGSGISSFPLK
jgi:hypothetical protein